MFAMSRQKKSLFPSSGDLTSPYISSHLLASPHISSHHFSLFVPLRTLQWSWFALVMACVHGGGLHNFCLKHSELHYISKVTHYLDYIVFVGGCILLMASVLTFRADLIRFQISQVRYAIFIFNFRFIYSDIIDVNIDRLDCIHDFFSHRFGACLCQKHHEW